MTEQQTGKGQATGGKGLSRGVFLVVCLVVVVMFVTIWVKLASKDIEVTVKQPATEQSAASGESKPGAQGDWYISLASFRLERDAQAMIKRLEQKGVNADSVTFIGKRKDYIFHRVRVSGFASEQEAQQELVILSKKIDMRDAWVGRTP